MLCTCISMYMSFLKHSILYHWMFGCMHLRLCQLTSVVGGGYAAIVVCVSGLRLEKEREGEGERERGS